LSQLPQGEGAVAGSILDMAEGGAAAVADLEVEGVAEEAAGVLAAVAQADDWH